MSWVEKVEVVEKDIEEFPTLCEPEECLSAQQPGRVRARGRSPTSRKAKNRLRDVLGDPSAAIIASSSSAVFTESTTCTNDPAALCLRRRGITSWNLRQVVSNMAKLRGNILSDLVELDLCKNRLSDLPDELPRMVPALQCLNLSGNLLPRVPPCIFEMTKLSTLILSSNRLSGELPGSISRLKRLKTLRLDDNHVTSLATLPEELQVLVCGSVYGGNNITELPKHLFPTVPNLKELDFSLNGLTALPDDFFHANSGLIRLNLDNNKLTALPRTICLAKTLKHLSISANCLTSLPVEVVDLNLEYLDLSDNYICVLPGEVLKWMKNTVLVNGNPMTDPKTSGSTNGRTNNRFSKYSVRPAIVEYDEDSVGVMATQFQLLFGNRSPSRSPRRPQTTPTLKTMLRKNDDCFANQNTPPLVNSFIRSRNTYEENSPPSLVELAARQVLFHSILIELSSLPPHLVLYLQNHARPCYWCNGPFVREYIIDECEGKYFGGGVWKRVRFCQWKCWKFFRENREQQTGYKSNRFVEATCADNAEVSRCRRTSWTLCCRRRNSGEKCSESGHSSDDCDDKSCTFGACKRTEDGGFVNRPGKPPPMSPPVTSFTDW